MSEKYASWVTLRPQWDHCLRGKAKLRILNSKTIYSEFQKPGQTAVTRGKAELCILDFKITWSAELRILGGLRKILKSFKQSGDCIHDAAHLK